MTALSEHLERSGANVRGQDSACAAPATEICDQERIIRQQLQPKRVEEFPALRNNGQFIKVMIDTYDSATPTEVCILNRLGLRRLTRNRAVHRPIRRRHRHPPIGLRGPANLE